jgi:DNA-binding transcriptional LysR family regulator
MQALHELARRYDGRMDIGQLHLKQLRLVDALAQNGNLSEAANRIGLSQSAASHALAALRRELQDPIFVRTADGMRPTPYGARLAASVAQALQQLRLGLDPAEFEPQTSKRTFNIFISGVEQMLLLPRLLARLRAEAPDISLRVRPIPLKAPHLMLESGEVDLAIGPFTSLISGCRQQRLFRERYVCVARLDHPAFKDGMTMEAFRKVPHALGEHAGHVHALLDRWLERQKVERTVKLHVPFFLALPPIVAHSDLMAIMAGRVAETYAAMLPLKIMQPPMKLPHYDIKLFWHERFHRDPGNRWLRGLFTELFRD